MDDEAPTITGAGVPSLAMWAGLSKKPASASHQEPSSKYFIHGL